MTEIDKVKYDEKMNSLKNRIIEKTIKISELEDERLCLMMVKRDMMMSHTKKVLEDCFTDELKDKIKNIKLFDEYSELVKDEMILDLVFEFIRDNELEKSDMLNDTLLEERS